MQKATEKYMAWMSKPFVKGWHQVAGDPGRVIRASREAARNRRALQRNEGNPRRLLHHRGADYTKRSNVRSTTLIWITAAPSK